jgi:fido (protein-threonine AMPylation protein)
LEINFNIEPPSSLDPSIKKLKALFLKKNKLVKELSSLSKTLLFKREALGNLQEQIYLKHLEALAGIEVKKLDRIKNVMQALEFIENKSRLDIAMICEMQAIFQKHLSQTSGHLRKKQNWIGPKGEPKEEGYFFPPKAKDVYGYLQKSLKLLKTSKKDPILKTAIFFAYFLIIHPFNDANGRVARALVFNLLRKEGINFVSPFFKKHRLLYFIHLYEITDQNKWQAWIAFFLKALKQESLSQIKLLNQLKKIDQKVKESKCFKKTEFEIVRQWLKNVVFKIRNEKDHEVYLKLKRLKLVEKRGGIYLIKGLYRFLR